MRQQRVTTPDGHVWYVRRRWARRRPRAPPRLAGPGLVAHPACLPGEVVAAIAEGRIDSAHGVVLFADRSKAP